MSETPKLLTMTVDHWEGIDIPNHDRRILMLLNEVCAQAARVQALEEELDQQNSTTHALNLAQQVRNLQAENQRLTEALKQARAILPRIHESLTNDTLADAPDEDESYPCECEDCGRLRIDALRAVWAALRDAPPTGEK